MPEPGSTADRRNPLRRVFSWGNKPERDAISLQDLLTQVGYLGQQYPLLHQTLTGESEEIGSDFRSYVCGAYKANGVVFACILVRLLLFSEARFQFRQMRGGRPGDLFGTADLAPLEEPWPGATTGDLLARAMQDADLNGNFFAVARPGGQIKRLRPDWTSIILDGDYAGDPDARVVGYAYKPGGSTSSIEPETFLAEKVCHYAPIPDPEASYRGMSWLTPIVNEIQADQAMTSHKEKFLTNGATPNLALKLAVTKAEDFQKWVDMFRAEHEGAANAYKTLFLGAGADIVPVGVDLKQLEFKQTQGAGETRIAAAAGVPPVIVGLSEGLQAATYSNYAQARRRFADMTMRPLWRNFAGSLKQIIKVPPGAELWYDDRDIPALREDADVATDILGKQAAMIRQLIDGGFEADSVVNAVNSGDLSRLVHSGLMSVQLQEPGVTPPADATPTNGTVMNSDQLVKALARDLANERGKE